LGVAQAPSPEWALEISPLFERPFRACSLIILFQGVALGYLELPLWGFRSAAIV
jgi:hypothetical protein